MDKNERIVAWAESHRDELLEDLKTLCRIPSVAGSPAENAPYGPGPAQALEAAMTMCQSYGFSVKNYDWRVMTADLGQAQGRALDILAHLDVVGPGDGWDSDPFEPVIRPDGYIYGRGVSDDKGGAVAALYALRCVQELGLPVRKGCRLILGTDEESGSGDIDYYYQREAPAPNTFSPDSEFPVCNAEKGMYRLRFRKTFSPETALPRVVSLHGGFRTNVIPTEASAVVAGMEPMHLMAGAAPLCAELGATCQVTQTPEGARLTVTGHGCHAASPELGINGNTVLFYVLSQLPLADCASTRAVEDIARLLPHGDHFGKALGIAQADEPTGMLTCAFTQIDMTEAGIEGLCDCRVPLCATAENCKDVAEGAMGTCGFEAAGMMIPPHYTSADSDFVRTLLECYETYTGKPGTCYSMGGGTYVHDVPGGVAFGIGMPGVDVRMHGANERYPVADLVTTVEIFAQAIAQLCQ
jgi:succinyl-diaminopimelate desuccinylase